MKIGREIDKRGSIAYLSDSLVVFFGIAKTPILFFGLNLPVEQDDPTRSTAI